KIISIYLADEFGNPIPPCVIGDPQTVLVWGVFNNTTGTSRYAIRTRTEAWLNGVFSTEFIDCSFDVLLSGQTAVALLGAINMTCGDELQLLNTWIAWNTSASQCQNSLGANYAFECNDYSPSKCFKNLNFIDFLTPTFSFSCQSQSQSTTNVCFTSSVFGGAPPYTYAWDFGDSGMSTAQNPCHTFSNAMDTYVVILTVTDSLGQSFAVSDTVDLDVLPCLNQVSVNPVCATPNSPIACPGVPVFEEPVVPDSCGMGILLTFTDVTTPGACPGDYSVTRTWIASDSCGNSGSCSVTIVVEDVLPPTLTCVAQTTPINCPAVPAFNPPTVSDACDGTVTLTFSDVTTPGACVGAY
ncbi:MAG TPA: PKD domain-containing protein, partial [Saprospiraceae bacterium]|nr:PKD domain-containing protein [Saprospiraceae bacterium]